ncbi:MAG: hypothetical protein J0L82_18685 [Deltaproteobacteria bacterium]|nr:hypothetical protein [Deltaproteobacteria bacterium]
MQLNYFDLQELDGLSSDSLRTIESVFDLWQEVYRPILAAANEELHPDAFFRARYLLCICDSDQPLAFCLMNSIDLKLAHNAGRSYFGPVPASRMNEFLVSKDKILSVEWVTVRPASRVQFKKIQMADLVMGAAFRFLHQTDHTLAMGYSRTDVGADRIAALFGVRPFEETQLHGINCRLMIGRREWVGKHRFSVVESAIESLWRSAHNFTMIKFKMDADTQLMEAGFENTRRSA